MALGGTPKYQAAAVKNVYSPYQAADRSAKDMTQSSPSSLYVLPNLENIMSSLNVKGKIVLTNYNPTNVFGMVKVSHRRKFAKIYS